MDNGELIQVLRGFQRRLNPFEIRASLKQQAVVNGKQYSGLNPFEIRASLKRYKGWKVIGEYLS